MEKLRKFKEPLYYRFGKPYRKIKRDEVIEIGAMHSYCFGELMPIKNPETVGMTPTDFSDERDFYNPINHVRPTEF